MTPSRRRYYFTPAPVVSGHRANGCDISRSTRRSLILGVIGFCHLEQWAMVASAIVSRFPPGKHPSKEIVGRGKSYDDLPPRFVVQIDYVITLCAEEVCPQMKNQKAKKLNWPLPDPAGREGTDEEKLARFRMTQDEIKKRLRDFVKETVLPVAS